MACLIHLLRAASKVGTTFPSEPDIIPPLSTDQYLHPDKVQPVAQTALANVSIANSDSEIFCLPEDNVFQMSSLCLAKRFFSRFFYSLKNAEELDEEIDEEIFVDKSLAIDCTKEFNPSLFNRVIFLTNTSKNQGGLITKITPYLGYIQVLDIDNPMYIFICRRPDGSIGDLEFPEEARPICIIKIDDFFNAALPQCVSSVIRPIIIEYYGDLGWWKK